MNDAFNHFVQNLNDPYLIIFASLIVGFSSGWMVAMVSGAAAEVYAYFVLKKHKEGHK